MTHAADASVGPHVVGDRLFFKMPDGSSVDPKIGGATAHEIVEMWGMGRKPMSGDRQRVSRATYCAARYRLLSAARSYRQWQASEPERFEHWLGWRKAMQRHMLQLRRAERVPAPAAWPFP